MPAFSTHLVKDITAAAAAREGSAFVIDLELQEGGRMALAFPAALCARLLHAVVLGAGDAARTRGDNSAPRPGEALTPVDIHALTSGIGVTDDGRSRIVVQVELAEGVPLDLAVTPDVARRWAQSMLRDADIAEIFAGGRPN